MKQFAALALIGSASAVHFNTFNPIHDDNFVVLWSANGFGPAATVWDAKNPHPGYPAG